MRPNGTARTGRLAAVRTGLLTGRLQARGCVILFGVRIAAPTRHVRKRADDALLASRSSEVCEASAGFVARR